MVKLFISDIDGTLTDGTVFYSEHGEELKQFSHRDGRGFHLLKEKTNCKTAWLTSETGGINAARANKLINLKTLDYFGDNISGKSKLEKALYICNELNIDLYTEVAFIGDDTNDLNLLEAVSYKACPSDAAREIKRLPGMNIIPHKGGQGAVRAFIDDLFLIGALELI